MIKNGVVVDLSDEVKLSQNLLKDNLKMKICYKYEWNIPIQNDTYISIHSADGKVSEKTAYSASGIVVEVGNDITSIFIGSYVAVFGISDCGTDETYVIANIRNVCVLDADVSMKAAALSGMGAQYINVLKQMNMPIGSKVAVCVKNTGLWHEILASFGYTEVTTEADYFLTDDIINNNSMFVPGADWGDGTVYLGKRIYPVAYISNCVKDNVEVFIECLKSGKIDIEKLIRKAGIKTLSEPDNNKNTIIDLSSALRVTEKDTDKIMSMLDENNIVIDNDGSVSYKFALDIIKKAKSKKNNVIIINSSTHTVFGVYANDLRKRTRPVIALSICAEGQNKAQSLFNAITKVNEWIACEPTTLTGNTDSSAVVVGYKDGSVATIRILPGNVSDFTELHWEGKTLIITASDVKGFGCIGSGINGVEVDNKISLECANARNDLILQVLGENRS